MLMSLQPRTPLANREAVAEHVLGMMIVLARRIREADMTLRQGDWEGRNRYIGRELYAKTLGIVGMGNIGSRVAEICHAAFNMQILYYDIVRREDAERRLAAKRCDLPTLLAEADFVSIHLPRSPDTLHIIGAQHLSLMKPTAYLINTARGGIVDEQALLKALQDNKIAGAGLDVFENEFTFKHSPFFELDNVIVTPHMAAHTQEAMVGMSMVAEDILRVLDGQRPVHPVNDPTTNA